MNLSDSASVAGSRPPSRSGAAQALSQHARLLSLETPLPPGALLVERLTAREAFSELFHFDIDCLSTSAHLELKALIGEELTLCLLQADGSHRAWHGYVSAAAQLGADGGLARYRLSLVPWLAFLARRHDSFMFQDKTVTEIAEEIFADYPQANYDIRVTQALRTWSVRTQYRESDLAFLQRILSWEGLSYYFEHEQSDSAEASAPDGQAPQDTKGPHARHKLVICDAQTQWPACPQATVHYRRLAATESEDALHALGALRQVGTNAVSLGAWDYKQLSGTVASEAAADAGELPVLEHYSGAGTYRYENADEAARLAGLRLQAATLASQSLLAHGSVRQLGPAQTFTLTDHPGLGAAPASASGDALLCLWVEHEAANNLEGGMKDLAGLSSDLIAGGAPRSAMQGETALEPGTYRNRAALVPVDVPVVSAWRAAPSVSGLHSARVVGIDKEALTTERDHRVKIQFPWQRGERPNPGGLDHPTPTGSDAASRDTAAPAQGGAGNAPGNEHSGTWVRVAEALAGPNWGSNFVPRIGSEVLVTFIDGDIDRPVIVGQLYNGEDTPPFFAGHDSGINHPGVLSGIHTQALEGEGYNQWVIDDASGQLRMRLASSLAASQLNLGHLIHQAPSSANRGAWRGSGFELRTDAWAVARAQEGLLISTSARPSAASTQLDAREALGQLTGAQELAKTLSDAASAQQALALEANEPQQRFIAKLDPQQLGQYAAAVNGQPAAKPQPGSREAGEPVERLAEALLLMDSPTTIALATPASTALFAGTQLHATVQADAQFDAAHTLSAVSGNATSLFTDAGGIQAIAANAPVTLQAHTDKLSVLADKSVTVTSVNESIAVKANQKITLIGAQASITLEGGDITFACPGTFSVKGTSHAFQGPGSGPATFSRLPDTRVKLFDQQIRALNELTGEPIANLPYKLTTAGGDVYFGITDQDGKTDRVATVSADDVRVEWGVRRPVSNS